MVPGEHAIAPLLDDPLLDDPLLDEPLLLDDVLDAVPPVPVDLPLKSKPPRIT